jgi:hypothetical protein
VKKNIATGFSYLPKGTSLAKHVKSHAVADESTLDIIGKPRLMEKRDIPAVF